MYKKKSNNKIFKHFLQRKQFPENIPRVVFYLEFERDRMIYIMLLQFKTSIPVQNSFQTTSYRILHRA